MLLLLSMLLLQLLFSFLLWQLFLREKLRPAVNVGCCVIVDCEPTSHLDTKDPPISSFFYVPFKPSLLTYST